jgi:type I restriction enzyme, S subunit
MWFTVPVGQLQARADPAYALAAAQVERRYANARYPLVQLGSLASTVQYGSSARPQNTGNVRVVRMSNVRDGTLDLTSHKWLDLSDSERARYRLEIGDVVFNRTNSKELVGKCAVFEDAGEWVFASYLIRVQFDRGYVDPYFVATFLSAPSGRAQIDRDSRQIIGMANVNASELREFLIPLPALDAQRALVAPVVESRREAERSKTVADQTDALVNGLLLEALAVELGDPGSLQTFAVMGSRLKDGRLDAGSYAPIVQLRGGREGDRIARLEEIAEINPRRAKPAERDGKVPYVGLPECSQKRITEVDQRDATGAIGNGVAMVGDILFARIEPSVFNRKYVFVDALFGNPSVQVSGEFLIISVDRRVVEPRYLHEVLLSDIVARQLVGKTTGSSGRRRIDRSVLGAIAIPLPELATQREIVARLSAQRTSVDDSLLTAEAGLQRAVADFEASIFQPS